MVRLGSGDVSLHHGESPRIQFHHQSKLSLDSIYPNETRLTFVFVDPDYSESSKAVVCVEAESEDNQYEYIFYRVDGAKVSPIDFVKTGPSKFQGVMLDSGHWSLQGDDILANWGAISVAPKITLTWTRGHISAVSQAVLNDSELKALSIDIGNEFKTMANYDSESKDAINLAPPMMAEEVLKLVYAGHPGAARRLFDLSWPNEHKGKERYWRFINHAAKQSKLWKYVMAIQRNG